MAAAVLTGSFDNASTHEIESGECIGPGRVGLATGEFERDEAVEFLTSD
jgi:hypothetical protein